MTYVTTLIGRTLLGIGIGAAALLWNGQVPTSGNTQLTSTADARIGRPATPRSFAGVARRTTARAWVGAGCVAAGTVAGATAVGNGCARVTGPYGRTVVVCR